ncbi:MAG: fatty acyl-AMP ligase [Thermoanaerobaculia bacterium]
MKAPPLDTLQQLLERSRDYPQSGLRFVDTGERETFHSWREIEERSAGIAGGLARLGLNPGDRVGLLYPTSIDFIVAFFGTLLASAVPVPLYPPVRLGRLSEYHARTAAMLDVTETRLLLVDPRIRNVIGETLATLPPRALGLGTRALAELGAQARLTTTGEPEDLALVQFSSGTTVEPRPVALTQRAILAQVRLLNAHWPARPDLPHGEPTGVSWLPLYHDMGLIGCVLTALERPSTLTLLPPESFIGKPALWLRALSRHRATISTAPTFAYALATQRIRDEELDGCDLSTWEVALCGAETVVPEVLRAFADRFEPWGFRPEALAPVYGLSEAALAVTFPPLGRPLLSHRFDRLALADRGEAVPGDVGLEIASVGRPLPGFEIELRDEQGETVAERRVGRLFLRGPSLLRGYLHQPEATAAALVDGWLDSGDLGFRLDGELYLTGRAKEMILVRGRNYAPADLELAVAGLVDARPGCVVAASHLPAGKATEELLLFVEHRKGVTGDALRRLEGSAREAVLARTGLAVDRVVVLAPGTIPRTSSGKLRRGETLRRYLCSSLTVPGKTGPIQLAWILARSRWKLLKGTK